MWELQSAQSPQEIELPVDEHTGARLFGQPVGVVPEVHGAS